MNITCTIDNKSITAEQGTTILTAAESLGIHIPTLCDLKGYPPFTSCMVCVVLDVKSDTLVPACSAMIEQGMEIETRSGIVIKARRETLNMLLTEHVGDCLAPCTRACPAHPDTPGIIRSIIKGDITGALRLYREVNPFPVITGHICPAPCEKLCSRGSLDSSVSIRLLEKYAGKMEMEDKAGGSEKPLPPTGKHIAVIGAGPAGLAAAYYSLLKGHACTLYEKEPVCGGEVRKSIPESRLPREVLDGQIRLLHHLGCTIKTNNALGSDFSFTEVRETYDAVILAIGRLPDDTSIVPASLIHNNTIKINKITFRTEVDKIFACGSCTGRTSMAVRGIAQGRQAAHMVDCFLSNKKLENRRVFDSVVRKYTHGELLELLKSASPGADTKPENGEESGFTVDEAIEESGRCMHCDCYKSKECLLRKYAAEYEGNQHRYELGGRRLVCRDTTHPFVVREMGKCIKCGRCVRLTRELIIGPGFIRRGYETEVALPFHFSLEQIPDSMVKQITTMCPTGALVFFSQRKKTPGNKGVRRDEQ